MKQSRTVSRVLLQSDGAGPECLEGWRRAAFAACSGVFWTPLAARFGNPLGPLGF